MTLKVSAPSEVVLEAEVTKVKAEAPNGWFGLLPRHVDFVTSLVPGILSFDVAGGKTEYLAIDHGVLVKCGPDVAVSTRLAVHGTDLATLKQTVEDQFRKMREKEQASVIFEARLEADLVRQLLEIERHV